MNKFLVPIVLLFILYFFSTQECMGQSQLEQTAGITLSQEKSQMLTPDMIREQEELKKREQDLYLASKRLAMQKTQGRSASVNRQDDIVCAGEEVEISVVIYTLGLPFAEFYAVWDFGDGTPLETSRLLEAYIGTVYRKHTYASEGEYLVQVKFLDKYGKPMIGTKGDTARTTVVVASCTLPQLPVNPNTHLILKK